ncbi:hypothetical protein G6M86_03620 [Agrobacterium tumefaciens]|uniref:Uncharacterized protein n=1 Tax=Agrobacterium tumefaciens TaxID=358 RepID=A0AAJ4MZV6_AGRTU|nr:hypothetical protein G6M86_03620 [Agrobacterium tumefaciens]
MTSVLRPWLSNLPLMQQAVLMTAVRAEDGTPKHHPMKDTVRLLRRAVFVSSFSGKEFDNPWEDEGQGGSFSRPLRHNQTVESVQDAFIDARDEMSHHYYTHFMHASHIIAVHHPDAVNRRIFREIYDRMVHALHLAPETDEAMTLRLSDSSAMWKAREDRSTNCSD